jgi:hypothetical protein
MSKFYKVWVEIEEIDEENDHYETVDCWGVETFDSVEAAEDYAATLCGYAGKAG